MKSELSLRAMTASDMPFADQLRALAGWNQTIQHWNQLLALAPSGCFVAEWNGSPAGTATTICYGADLGWIGMLLVHPEFRSRGIGRALLAHCLEHLRGRGIRCIKLDATRQGKLLYDQLGFQEEWPLTRWKMPGLQACTSAKCEEVRPCRSSDIGLVERLDGEAFGVARPALLQSLLRAGRQAFIYETNEGLTGFGMIREGAHAHHLGPVIAETPRTAALLAEALLATAGGKPIYWDIPDVNSDAAILAKSLGFVAERHWMRMYLGPNTSPGSARRYFAIADPSLG